MALLAAQSHSELGCFVHEGLLPAAARHSAEKAQLHSVLGGSFTSEVHLLGPVGRH